jgi:hypothetical protein
LKSIPISFCCRFRDYCRRLGEGKQGKCGESFWSLVSGRWGDGKWQTENGNWNYASHEAAKEIFDAIYMIDQILFCQRQGKKRFLRCARLRRAPVGMTHTIAAARASVGMMTDLRVFLDAGSSPA